MCPFVVGFLKIAEYYSMLWMCCSLFKHSLIQVYLDNFHTLALTPWKKSYDKPRQHVTV